MLPLKNGEVTKIWQLVLLLN